MKHEYQYGWDGARILTDEQRQYWRTAEKLCRLFYHPTTDSRIRVLAEVKLDKHLRRNGQLHHFIPPRMVRLFPQMKWGNYYEPAPQTTGLRENNPRLRKDRTFQLSKIAAKPPSASELKLAYLLQFAGLFHRDRGGFTAVEITHIMGYKNVSSFHRSIGTEGLRVRGYKVKTCDRKRHPSSGGRTSQGWNELRSTFYIEPLMKKDEDVPAADHWLTYSGEGTIMHGDVMWRSKT